MIVANFKMRYRSTRCVRLTMGKIYRAVNALAGQSRVFETTGLGSDTRLSKRRSPTPDLDVVILHYTVPFPMCIFD